MNQEQLESLTYPMFETTEEEKECLREALSYITAEDREYFLCLILQYVIGTKSGLLLRDKIEEVIGESYTLSDYLGFGHSKDDALHADLRRIWVRKLLAYKPE